MSRYFMGLSIPLTVFVTATVVPGYYLFQEWSFSLVRPALPVIHTKSVLPVIPTLSVIPAKAGISLNEPVS